MEIRLLTSNNIFTILDLICLISLGPMMMQQHTRGSGQCQRVQLTTLGSLADESTTILGALTMRVQ